MTSNMMAGEKKWASARRSGMTVLGKVAVPKPLNLPSQKLENHGLDPNVEIVPKGTLSWGSQASSVPNAWGSSLASPNADGSTGSPRHLSGRPSSGNGTRPSTAGSDRTQDPTPNVWGPTSRPSSASGASATNNTVLTSLRPRSAETRPGSSQLSRFAEPPPANSLVWGPNGASNKLGTAPSNNDGFSLSSGDFPSLGSEKDGPVKNIDSQEHGCNSRPGSSSSRAASGKEKIVTSLVGDVKSETANTWTRDGSQHAELGIQPTAEWWQGDISHGGNPQRPPQHFNGWHGPPLNHPPAGWYGGPNGVPPYGVPLHPSGFPMEPFPYYRPQIPPNTTHHVPPRTTAPRENHPKNGELCRPHVPEGYIHPRMPINPGFYPTPPTYEGFYGPPMGYCNPQERDMPFMGMPPGPPVYKRYPCEKAIDHHPRSSLHGFRGKLSTPERIEPRSGYSDDARGPYKVLLKQSNEQDEKRGEWDHSVPSSIHCYKKNDQQRESKQKYEWGLEDDQETYPSDFAKFPETRGKANTVVDSLGSKSGSPKGSTLMHKIDGLNAKARNSDGRSDFPTILCMENQYNQPPAKETGPLRRPTHGAQGRVDYRGKRLNNQNLAGWQNKLHAGESFVEVSTTKLEASPNVIVHHRHTILEESEKSELNLQNKDEDEYCTRFVDESNTLAQRAKMREIAKQRAEKLQKEEEERTREQKAKALAKLEELNRRSHIADASSLKMENVQLRGTVPPRETAHQEKEKSRKSVESDTDFSKPEPSSSAAVQNHKDMIRDGNSIMVVGNTVVFNVPLPTKPENVHPMSELVSSTAASQTSNVIFPKHKQTEYKQKQSVNSAKDVIQKSISTVETGALNCKAANDLALLENIAKEMTSSGDMSQSSTNHKRKNIRSSRNKHKVDGVVPSTVVKESYVEKISTEMHEQDSNWPHLKAAANSVQELEHYSSSSEETSGKGNHQLKPQQPRRMPKNQQSNNRIEERERLRSSETVTWAPIRSQNKIEPIVKPEPESDIANAKVESVMQNNMKAKRAEMERYVPKPIAEELAQQGTMHVVAQNRKSTQHDDSATADAGSTAKSKNGDGKHNNPSTARGLWKQRVYVELVLNQGMQEAGKKPIEQNLPMKSDAISSQEQITDGWNSNDNSDTSASITNAVTKSEGVPGRGKRHPVKGNRNTGNNFELDHGDDRSSGRNDEAPSDSVVAHEMNQMHKNNAFKENRFVGERTPHWQPKAQMYTVRNRHSEGIRVDTPANETQIDQPHTEPVHQGFIKRERKPASSRGRPRTPNISSGNTIVESDIMYEKKDQQQFSSSGYRKNVNHNNQSGRGQEPRGGDAPFNQERQRRSSHFEYQPVGQFGNKGGSTDGSYNARQKYRERNQGHHGRQTGGGHLDASYD